jgi:addiction module HigA family antidote
MKKKIPTFKTDAEAERFVDTADLSKYDLSSLKALKMKNPPQHGFSVRVDCLEPHGLTVTEGAKVLGVSRSALSHLVNEGADLSWDMAIRLAKAFGSTPEGWMRLQFQYDAAQVEERSKKIKVKMFADVVHA